MPDIGRSLQLYMNVTCVQTRISFIRIVLVSIKLLRIQILHGRKPVVDPVTFSTGVSSGSDNGRTRRDDLEFELVQYLFTCSISTSKCAFTVVDDLVLCVTCV